MASRVIVWETSRWAMMMLAPAWARAIAMAAPIPMGECQMGRKEKTQGICQGMRRETRETNLENLR